MPQASRVHVGAQVRERLRYKSPDASKIQGLQIKCPKTLVWRNTSEGPGCVHHVTRPCWLILQPTHPFHSPVSRLLCHVETGALAIQSWCVSGFCAAIISARERSPAVAGPGMCRQSSEVSTNHHHGQTPRCHHPRSKSQVASYALLPRCHNSLPVSTHKRTYSILRLARPSHTPDAELSRLD